MEHVYCPHCLERVQVDAPDGGVQRTCPICLQNIDADLDETAPKDYHAHAPVIKPQKHKEGKEYVQFLQDRARKELDKKPYHRKPPRVNLYAGLILIGIGLALLVRAIMSGEGMMSLLINGILFSCVFFLCGVACLVFHNK